MTGLEALLVNKRKKKRSAAQKRATAKMLRARWGKKAKRKSKVRKSRKATKRARTLYQLDKSSGMVQKLQKGVKIVARRPIKSKRIKTKNRLSKGSMSSMAKGGSAYLPKGVRAASPLVYFANRKMRKANPRRHRRNPVIMGMDTKQLLKMVGGIVLGGAVAQYGAKLYKNIPFVGKYFSNLYVNIAFKGVVGLGIGHFVSKKDKHLGKGIMIGTGVIMARDLANKFLGITWAGKTEGMGEIEYDMSGIEEDIGVIESDMGVIESDLGEFGEFGEEDQFGEENLEGDEYVY